MLYHWQHFWYPGESTINLLDGGYLYRPDREWAHLSFVLIFGSWPDVVNRDRNASGQGFLSASLADLFRYDSQEHRATPGYLAI